MERQPIDPNSIERGLGSPCAELKGKWNALLDDLDMARYAPGQVPPPEALLAEAEALVESTEKNWIA